MSFSKEIKILGDVLLRSDGCLVPVDIVCTRSKILGLYFSSFSCPSCSAFTPELIRFYKHVKENRKEFGFEVLYVSSDCDEKQFSDNIKLLPWFSVPFNQIEQKLSLTRAFKVLSIPSLVLIDAKTYEVITVHGKTSLLDDPQGLCFPWKSRDPVDVLKELSIITSNGEKVAFESLSDSIKGIYFSAHWCPPCRAFTPLLTRLYKKLQKNGKKFEVIFISSDLTEQSFVQYFSKMPWLAVSYQDHHRRKELAQLYGVGGIPSLVILNEANKIITKGGRIEINDDPDGEDFPWRAKLVEELSEKHVSKLNEEPCLILFTAYEEKDLDRAHYLLLPAAEEYKARVQRAEAEDTAISLLNFYYAGDAEICESVRDAVQVNDRVPLVVILDMLKKCKYILDSKKEVTSDVIGKFVRDFLASKLTAHSVDL